MFSIDNLKDNSKIYLLGLIDKHNKYNYTRIDYFDITYNNQIFNPFIDKLVDLKYPIYECKYIDWNNCIEHYQNTKYKEYFNNWFNQYKNNINISTDLIYHTGKLSKTYKNRNDYITIEILYNIYNKDYLKSMYKNVSINNFKYLNEDIYIYELPADTKKYIHFGDYIKILINSEIVEMDESLMIDKTYKNNIDTFIISLKNRERYFYKTL